MGEPRVEVQSVTPLRGFFRHIVDNPEFPLAIDARAVESLHDTVGASRRLLSRMVRSPLGRVGVIPIRSVRGGACDAYLSYNRLIRCDRPYLIVMENPTALCHYSLSLLRSPFARHQMTSLLAEESLVAVVCMSEVCRESAPVVLGIPWLAGKLRQIYPYVPDDTLVSPASIYERCRAETVRFLFVALGPSFTPKGGLEVVTAFNSIRQGGDAAELTVICNRDSLPRSAHRLVDESPGVTVIDGPMPFDQLREVYRSHHALVHPSSMDSFPLTILEAMKAGLAVICSRLYALPEMVANDRNGLVVEPKRWFFSPDGLPNPEVWNHRSLLQDEGVSETLVASIRSGMANLCADRALLARWSIESLNKSRTTFGETALFEQWRELGRLVPGQGF